MRLILSVLLAAVATAAIAQGQIVARVNGTAIDEKQVDDEVERLIPQVYYHRRVTDERRSEFRQQAIDLLIERELKYQDARARGLEAEKKAVREQMKLVRAKFSSRREYTSALERTGLSEEVLRRDIERTLIIQKAEDLMVNGPARVNDEHMMRDYYAGNSERYRLPATVSMRMISVAEERKARDARERIGKGEPFADVAGSLSEDKYRIRGGDVGEVHQGRLVPELEKIAFSLQEGEVSDPVRVRDLWYILKIDRKNAERQLGFDEVKDRIRAELEQDRAETLREAWLGSLRQKAVIERFDAAADAAAGPSGAGVK